jgi:hypothetical protein
MIPWCFDKSSFLLQSRKTSNKGSLLCRIVVIVGCPIVTELVIGEFVIGIVIPPMTSLTIFIVIMSINHNATREAYPFLSTCSCATERNQFHLHPS